MPRFSYKPEPTPKSPRLYLWMHPWVDGPKEWNFSDLMYHPGIVPLIRAGIGNDTQVVNEWNGTDIAYHAKYLRPPGMSARPTTLQGWVDTVADHLEWWGFTRDRYGEFCPAGLYPAYIASRYSGLLVQTRLFTHPTDASDITDPFKHISLLPVQGVSQTFSSVTALAESLDTTLRNRGLSVPQLMLDFESVQNYPYQGPDYQLAVNWTDSEAWSAWKDTEKPNSRWDSIVVGGKTMQQWYDDFPYDPIVEQSIHSVGNIPFMTYWRPLIYEVVSWFLNEAVYKPWRVVFGPNAPVSNYDSMNSTGIVEGFVPRLNQRFTRLPRFGYGVTYSEPVLYGIPVLGWEDPPRNRERNRAYARAVMKSVAKAGGRLRPWFVYEGGHPYDDIIGLEDSMNELVSLGGSEAVLWMLNVNEPRRKSAQILGMMDRLWNL